MTQAGHCLTVSLSLMIVQQTPFTHIRARHDPTTDSFQSRPTCYRISHVTSDFLDEI